MQTDVTARLRPTPSEDSAPPETSAGTSRWVIVTILALGWAAGVVWRLWLGHPVGSPIAHADEDSYVNVARAIAGGPTGFSSETPLLRRVGYPMYISPAFLGGLDFTQSYRLVQLLNAIANAAVLPIAYLLARRMFRLGQWPAMAAAFATATLPAVLFWSLIGMTDSVMSLLFLGWLLAIHWWLGSPARKWAGLTAGLVTGLLYTVHVRGTILAAVFAALLLLMAVRRRATWGVATLSAAPVVAFVILNQAIISWLGDRVRLRGDIVGTGTVDVLTSPDRLQILFIAVGNQLWYLCVITLGLAGVAWTVTLAGLWRPTRDAAFRWTATVALAGTLAVILASSLILAGLLTNNDSIYTRYVQMFVPFWLLFGFAALLDADLRAVLRRAVVPVLVMTVGGALIALRLWWVVDHNDGYLAYGVFGGPDLMTITAGWTRLRPLVATAIGLVGFAVLIAATRKRRLVVPALLAIVLANVATMAVMRDKVLVPQGAGTNLDLRLRDVGVGPGDRVAMTTGVPGKLYFSLYHEVTWMEVNLTEVPPKDINVMLTRWQVEGKKEWDGPRYGFRRIGTSPAQNWAVWRRN